MMSGRKPWLDEDHPNILLSSAGRRTYLVNWFRDALNGAGEVHASNSDASATALAAADKGVVAPLIYSPDYIPFMLNYCAENGIGAIIPLFDVDVPVLAENRARFEEIGCLPIVAPVEFARACSDKLSAARLLKAEGIRTPETYIGSGEYLAAIVEGKERFPAFIKPRWGMGSIGLAKAYNEMELNVLCGVVQREVKDSYLRYESSSVEADQSVIVQPSLLGKEYGMDVVCDLEGSYRGCVVRRKLAMRAGETDVAEIMEPDERFIELAQRLACISRHPGNMDVDVFDVDGDLFVLEMNARFGGGYPFSHAAGIDLPSALVAWLRGVDNCENCLKITKPGVYMKDIVITSIAESSEAR